MSEQSVFLLKAVWIWLDALVAFLALGGVVPGALGFIGGMLPLAARRRDWRPVWQLMLVFLVVAVSGVVALSLVQEPAPERAFWLVLSMQTGFLVFVFALIATLRLSRRRIREEREALAAVSTLRIQQEESPRTSREPEPRSRLSGFEAEYWIAEWMRHLGAAEAVVTPSRRDGGVDVRSDHYVAQVKHRPGDFISVDLVRALAGVAGTEHRTPLFFSSSHYSRDAIAFANTTGMALFIFRPTEGRLVGANAAAARLRAAGLLGRSRESSPSEPTHAEVRRVDRAPGPSLRADSTSVPR